MADNHTGLSTVYDASGNKQSLVVTIPPAAGSTTGAPSGVLPNRTTDFVIPGSTAATFIFAGEDGDILIGNFGDGLIGAYDPSSGALVDLLRDASGNPISIDGLWGLAFGPSAGSTTLYFAAGPNDETHGLIGTLTVP